MYSKRFMGYIVYVSNKVYFLKFYNFFNCKIYKFGGGGGGNMDFKKKDIVNILYVNQDVFIFI